MSEDRPRIRPIQQLIAAAGAAVELELPTETAESDPVLTSSEGRLCAVTLYYKLPPVRLPRDEFYIIPPHHRLLLDALTAEVVRFEGCVPQDFGQPHQQGAHIVGPVLPPELTYAAHEQHARTMLEQSATVWQAFADRPPLTPALAEAANAYLEALLTIAKQPLVPYYRAAAPDFFTWLDRAAGA